MRMLSDARDPTRPRSCYSRHRTGYARPMIDEEKGPDTAEGEEGSKLSEHVPDKVSGDGDTPLGSTDEHSDAPEPSAEDDENAR